MNEEKIEALGSFKNANIEDFLEALKKEAELSGNQICKRAIKLYTNWRNSKNEFPPYIGYLALFVLAATTEGEFDPKAYYPRYWELIGTPREGAPDGFYETDKLWDDLEKWSIEEKKEELGRFKAKIRGHWCHVGRPLSQTLLSEDERKSLGSIFYDCGFDPNNPPSEIIIKNGLVRHGAKRLRHRTLALLKNEEAENQEFVKSLLDLVVTELEEWGRFEPNTLIPIVETTVKKQLADKSQEVPAPSLFFRTCLEVDHRKQLVVVSLRLKTKKPFPPNRLRFEVNEKILFCTETGQNWSTRLIEMPSNKVFDPFSLSWLRNWLFANGENGWDATFRSDSIRLFLPADTEGLPGFVESQKLQRDSEFYIICNNRIGKTVNEWGSKSCSSFSRLSYAGIPSEWTLFRGVGATKSCEGIDVLSLSNLLRIKLEGGIGIGYSNQYLCFAPPKVQVDGGLGGETVLLNGIAIEKSTANTWQLPKNTPIGRPLNIQVSRNNELLQESRLIELIEPSVNPKLFDSLPKRDNKGRLLEVDKEENFARGAFVSLPNHPNPEFNRLPNTSPTSIGDSLIFIGQIAGQTCRWSGSDTKGPK